MSSCGWVFAWHRAPVPSLRSLRRGLVPTSSVLSALQLAFPAPAGPVPLLGGSWGCQRKGGSLRGLLLRIGKPKSCPRSQGNSPNHQQCKSGRVPLAKSRCFHHSCGQGELASQDSFLTLWVCCGQQEQRRRRPGARGTEGVSSAIVPGECQAVREACMACFDISSCQTIN